MRIGCARFHHGVFRVEPGEWQYQHRQKRRQFQRDGFGYPPKGHPQAKHRHGCGWSFQDEILREQTKEDGTQKWSRDESEHLHGKSRLAEVAAGLVLGAKISSARSSDNRTRSSTCCISPSLVRVLKKCSPNPRDSCVAPITMQSPRRRRN